MNQEIIWLRNLRLIASIAVVTVHVSAQSLLYFPPKTSSGWESLLIMNCLAHLAIPIFIMVSGALILPKKPSESWRRTKKIIYLIIFWSLIYILFSHFVYRDVISLKHTISLILKGNAFYHLYYLYAAGGLYLITPLIQKIITNKKNTLLLLSTILPSTLVIIGTMYFTTKKIIDPVLSLLFIEYIGYYILGYYLFSYPPKFLNKWVGNLFLIFLGTALNYSIIKLTNDLTYSLHYLSLGNFITAVGTFMLFKNTFNQKIILPTIAPRSTLGIYLLHLIVLISLEKLIHLNASIIHPLLGVPLVVIIVYTITWLLVLLLQKTPLKIMVN